MKLELAERIRTLRKARGLTQQQLADALNVTTGAVYKWEAGLSAPDLSLLVELADLFDTSVDVLLGYQVKNNKQQAVVERLKGYLLARDKTGLAEAEKALLRYPNSFAVVHGSAMLYYNFGLASRDAGLLHRTIELLEQATLLLGQNTDPEIGELSLLADMANAWSCLGNEEKALEILKRDNPRGINNDSIGLSLAGACDRPDEAAGYLSAALLDALASLVRIVMGYVNVYFKKGDYATGRALLRLTLDFLAGFKQEGKSNLLDKPCIAFLVCLALANLELGLADEARQALRNAKALAAAFDAAPDYSANSVRYVFTARRHIAYDNLGGTAIESIRQALHDMGSEALEQLWDEVRAEP